MGALERSIRAAGQALDRILARRSLFGIVTGTLFLAASLTPSFTPRPPILMGALAGICLAAGYLLGVSGRGLWTYLGLALPTVRAGVARLVVALCLLATLVAAWRSIDWQNELRALFGMDLLSRWEMLIVLTLAAFLAALLFLAGRGIRALYLRAWRWLGQRVPPRLAVVLGIVVTAGLVWALVTGVVLRAGLRFADSSFGAVDAVLEPDVSRPSSSLQVGSNASLIPWESLGRRGREYVATGPSRADIATAVGGQVEQPVRVYAGLNSAADPAARARLALAELKRVGGFDRSLLVIIVGSPGTELEFAL